MTTAYAQELRDVKAPVGLPLEFGWGYLFIFLLLVAVGGAVFYWWKKYKNKPAAVPQVDVKPPWIKAFELLAQLQKENLLAQGKMVEYYQRLSDIVRHYIEDRFSIRAPEMTTEEFLLSLQYSPKLNTNQKESLKDFLTCCDMVKFAKYAPPPEEAEKGFGLAKKLVEETKQRREVEK